MVVPYNQALSYMSLQLDLTGTGTKNYKKVAWQQGEM